MQIVLTQAEIEQAISNFIVEQVNIREGYTLNIELRAGRGPEGHTATIDIVEDTAVAPTSTGIREQVRAARAPATEPKEAPEEPKQEAVAVTEEPAEASEPASEEAEASSAKSLFRNLQRPRNN